MTYSVNVIIPVIEQIKKVLEEDNKIYLEGANKSFDLPEFNSLEVAKNFINILDKKEMVADMLDSGFAEDINVYIGEENEKEQLKDFSVVTFKHKVNGKDLGTIGIIGPKPVNQLIEEIKFVLLGSRMMMAVILTDTGLVKETIIKFDEDINEKQVETMNYMFNNKLKGQPIETIDRPL